MGFGIRRNWITDRKVRKETVIGQTKNRSEAKSLFHTHTGGVEGEGGLRGGVVGEKTE